MTSHIVKVYERILPKLIVEYFEQNSVLSEKQHGFRSGRCTLTQLHVHFDKICSGLIVNKDTESICLDYAKALDKMDHQLLMLILEKYKFHPKLITYIKSFLLDRILEFVEKWKKFRSC